MYYCKSKPILLQSFTRMSQTNKLSLGRDQTAGLQSYLRSVGPHFSKELASQLIIGGFLRQQMTIWNPLQYCKKGGTSVATFWDVNLCKK
jgi:hypothetical protein